MNVDPPEQITPNMCQRKNRCANDIVDVVKDLQLSENDTIDAICLSLKKLGIFDKIHSFCRKPAKVGRKLTPISTRSLVWNFWHKNSFQSTITSRPASLRVTDKKQNTKRVRICGYIGDCYEKEASILSKSLVYY